MNRFENQVVCITGAGSGIGRATALSFAREGAQVIVSDISESGGRQTVSLVEAQGGKSTFLICDVADPAQLASLVQQTVALHGRLDIAINNAGVGGNIAKVADVTAEDYLRTVNINLGGVFFGMQHQIRQMLVQGSGRIVNVASVAGLRALPNSSVYTATKHAVVGLTKSGRYGVCPQKYPDQCRMPGIYPLGYGGSDVRPGSEL